VTSKNAPALSVVRNRLPKSIQDLCVDVSMSELSGMRQLQQTVERLANRVSCVGTSSGLQAEKCSFLRGQIKQLEQEIADVAGKLLEHSTRVRSLLQQKDGKQFVALSLELIEVAPWLMALVPTWTVLELARVRDSLGDLVLDENDPVFDVTGFDSNSADDGLISKVASCAGRVSSLLSNVAKSALASVPVLGSLSGLSEETIRVQERLDSIRIRGNPPVSKEDWKVVLRALIRARAITLFELTTWKPQQYKNAWPVFPAALANHEIRTIHEIFCKVVYWKELAVELDLSSEVESAIESRALDAHRNLLSLQIQRLAEDLVDAEVMEQLSRSFSAEAQSALIRFSQIAGRARFGRSSSSLQSKMSQRQKRRRGEYLEAFDRCCRFIPCWILTCSQISDYLPPECIFDLVIIDEASQSDITVLPGMLRATQWLTVGDSKQVSPTESFIAEEQIESLRASLPTGPLSDSFMPGQSFFDLCAQAFPQGRVVLSEHFRCAEEIISFSNEQFYDGRLVPLRLPTKSERLTPSIVDVKVDGTKVGKVNQVEANKIVEMIQDLVEENQDTAALDTSRPRTIGIISLMGEEQVRLIRGRLLDVIGPHMMAKHEILVGVPPSFQGAERDIIFLSMVASPGSVPTQNQVMHVQRVNVAMSRARDRCVLVRSIEPHQIGNQEDIKLPVIEFFKAAVAAGVEAENAKMDSAGAISNDAGVEAENAKMDSAEAISNDPNVEKSKHSSIDALLQNLLEQRGFLVRSMGVVWRNAICVEHESEDRRAALIVDSAGDSSSSVQEWLASYAQQKAIQRVGWKCMRVDALSLVADFNGTMQSVVGFLASAGVEERPLLYDQLEEETAQVSETQPKEMQIDEQGADEEDMKRDQEGEVDNLDGIEPEGNRLEDPANDERSNPGNENQEEAAGVADLNQPEEIVVISSEDEDDDRKMPPPALLPPQPDSVSSGHLAIMEDNNAGDFGQVVQLGFLEQRGVQYANADEDDSVTSDAYHGDLSDMGGDAVAANGPNGSDESGRQTSNRRRRLDRYARDPGWYPPRAEDRDLYDTDSDLDVGDKHTVTK
jgi:AAA domain